MKFKPHISSFKSKLTILVLAALLFPLLTAGLIFGNLLQTEIHKLYQNELKAGLSFIELIISLIEEDLVDQINRIAEDKRVKDDLSQSENLQLKKTLTTQRKVLDISLLAIFDLNGERLASSKFKSRKLNINFNIRDRLYIITKDMNSFLIYVTAISDKDDALGYVVGGMQLNDEDFVSFLHEKQIYNFAFWLNGYLILTDLPQKEELATIPSYQIGQHLPLQLAEENYRGMIDARHWGRDKLEYAKLSRLANLDEAMFNLIILVSIVVVILFIIFWSLLSLIIGKIARPLNRLTDYTNQLSTNNFAPLADFTLEILTIQSHDEIGKLAESFLQMQRQLQTYLKNLRETTRAKARMQSELKIARQIQMSMLPKPIPAFSNGNHFDISATLEPAREVGGDFYDYFMIDDHHLCIIIGDVSDKGVPASLFMAMSKTLLRAFTTLTYTVYSESFAPEKILERVNQELARDNDFNMFVTIFYGIFDLQIGVFNFTTGGHHPPYLLSKRNGVTLIDQIQAAPLGVKKQVNYRSESITLNHGDALFFYTDGITEAMDKNGDFYSEERLEKALSNSTSLHANELTSHIFAEVKKFSGNTPQNDDITALALRYI